MRVIGNILWVFFGGALLCIMWCIAGLICFCSIILIPVGIQCFKFATLVLWPFGREIISSSTTGSFILNFIWIVFFGWTLACVSLAVGLLWCLTVVGIPFGLQCFKFAKLALLPFGSNVVKTH